MRAAVGFVVGLVALGCESPNRMVYADLAVRDATVSAVNAWNLKLDSMCPEIGFSMTEERSEADVVVSLGDPPDGDCDGECMGAEVDGDVIVDETKARQYPAMLPAVIGHELGHVLRYSAPDGNNHSSNSNDLMFAPLAKDRSPAPTGRDVARLCASWGG